MNFRLLGPLEVDDDGGAALAIGTGRQCALLGLLILRANELVPTEQLVEELWGESPPPTAQKMLHNQVSALRQALGRNGRLETLGSAYRLNVAPGERDIDRFEELVARGRSQTDRDPERAAKTLREALGMWRGPPLADLAYESFAQAETARLEERRWAAFESCVEAELAIGRHADVVAELEAAVKEQPLREHVHGQLMLALYRCGRQAEALEAYRRARATLVEEIGIEPGAELRALQDAILAQDPLLVHRLAAEWAQVRASAAVGQSARRATSDRGELRSAERDLAGDLLHLRSLDDRARRYGGEEPPAAAVCPFLGLATFDADHADYFFGRERLVAELVARLVGSPLLAVVGPSGSGKSSAVRAGLLPALAQGVLPGSERRRQALIRPGPRPVAELARALVDEPAILVVDQFEEAFTVCRDARERANFLDELVNVVEARTVQLVLAMRADFYGHCATDERLARLVAANQVLVGPMDRDELRRAIEEPARRVGLHVEPSLTEALIADTLDQSGGLPLLSAALLEQWREREGRTLRHAAYERTGGVSGAVGRLAEQTYTTLSEPEQRAARAILLRLADAGEHGAAFVRRRMPLDELDPDEHTAAAREALIDGRLVTAQDETLEVAHEALLREWPRLRRWLEEDAEGRRLHQHLIGAARDWQASGRDGGELYRGARLASTLDWAAGHEAELNALERDFIAASRAEAQHEAEHQRRTNRRLRALLAGFAVLLLLALGAGVVALNQRGDARDAARAADAQRLGVEARDLERLDQALLFARAAVELDETPDTLSSLLAVLQRDPATLGAVDHEWGIFGAAISPDGELMAIGDDIGNVVVYDAASRQPLGRPYSIDGGIIQNVRFSPDGDTLAVSYMDRNVAELSGAFDLIDPRSGERRLRLRLPAHEGPPDFVYSDVVFLPDGDLLVRPVHGASPNAPAWPIYRVDGETGAIADRLQVGRSASDFYASETVDGRCLPHQPARQPHLGDRLRPAQHHALVAGGRRGRGGQPRRAALRAGVAKGADPAARPELRAGDAAHRRTRRPDPADALRAGRPHARDLREGRAGTRLGRRAACRCRAALRAQPRGRRPRPHGRRPDADHGLGGLAGDPLGPRGRTPARPAVPRRPPVRPAVCAARDRGQP